MTAEYAALPTLAAGAVRGQVSSPPLRIPTRNVGRAPAVVPHVLSVSEHNPDATLDLDDLGVVADSRRLYLLSLSTGPAVLSADGYRPDRFDVIGALVCLAGMAVIVYVPRGN